MQADELPARQMVPAQVSVILGDRTFRDKVEWSLTAPHNLPERYAASVCSELGLDWQDARAIAAALQQQITLHLQVSRLDCCQFINITLALKNGVARNCYARLKYVSTQMEIYEP